MAYTRPPGFLKPRRSYGFETKQSSEVLGIKSMEKRPKMQLSERFGSGFGCFLVIIAENRE